MGTHINAPAKIKGSLVPLHDIVAANLIALLGEPVFKKYGAQLPFLFKVLSIGKALSIQVHPDKALAKELHARDPQHYPGTLAARPSDIDDNHKPEMAIAITPFRAFCGFRPLGEIAHFLASVPELTNLIGSGNVEEFNQNRMEDPKASLRKIFSTLMHTTSEQASSQAKALVARARKNGELGGDSSLADLIIELNSQFPGDIGLFCAFFLNYITLQPGEAIFLRAREIHAYISGGSPFHCFAESDIVECMASSDNVIRAGLTPKFKDVKTLIDILTYSALPASEQKMRPQKFENCLFSTLYDPPIDEFSVIRTEMADNQLEEMRPIRGPSILIITAGTVVISKPMWPMRTASEGSVWFIGANQKIRLTATSEKVVVHRAFVE
jgi:mannose-6-phosphate isomerase